MFARGALVHICPNTSQNTFAAFETRYTSKSGANAASGGTLRAGGTPSALALKPFFIMNLKLEPWCRQARWQNLAAGSNYWIQVEKLDDLAQPDLTLWITGRVNGAWVRLWEHSWTDGIYKGNDDDN